MSAELVRYDAMCRAIADAYELDEVKDVRDRVAALEHYARQAHNVEAERQCCEIRLRAERKWGQLYAAGEKAKGARGNPGGQGAAIVPSSDTSTQTLADMGVSYDQSSQWQQLGAVPDEQFEASLASVDKPTINRILNGARSPEITPVSADALWLWGRLCEFERHEVFDTEPEKFLDTMVPHMLDTVRTLAPQLAQWLNQVGDKLNGS